MTKKAVKAQVDLLGSKVGVSTPGPWQFYADTPSTEPNWHIVTNASRLRLIANIHIEPGNEMDAANARLIAAAPELAEALRAWQAFWDDMPKGQLGKIACDVGMLNDAFIKTSAALAKLDTDSTK